jgi:hypothetical protein
MKTSIAIRALGTGALLFTVGLLWPASFSSTASAQEITVGVDVEGPEVETESFRPALSPYGEWVEYPGYGSVWRPYRRIVGADFVPYGSSGHWVYTDAGWVWASSYDWGWATFHYGNWVYVGDDWAWRPGRVWAPAWVEWRYGGGYVGWAPMAPVGIAYVGFQPAPVQYVFVHTNNFTENNVRTHVIVGAQAQVIVRQTEPMASVRVESGHTVSAVNAGPRPEVIGQATGRTVAPVAVHSIAAAAPPRATPGVRYAAGASAEHPIAVRANTPASAVPPKGTGEALKPVPAVSKAPSGSSQRIRTEPPTQAHAAPPQPATHTRPPPPAAHANESPARPAPSSMGSNPRPPAASARPVEHQASPSRPPPPAQRPPEARPPPPRPPPVAHPSQQPHQQEHESAPHASAAP